MNKKSKKIFLGIIFAISLAIFLTCAVVLIMKFLPKKEDFSKFKNDVPQSDTEVVLPENTINFEAVKSQNDETCGWIKIPGTTIDYPILQSGINTEESFYLTHNFKKKKSAEGAIYIQKYNRNDFSDPCTVIYGHNMLNGTMFWQLRYFKNKNFFNQNDTINIYIPGHELTYKIFAAFVYDDRHILNSYNFYEKDDYSAFLDEVLNPIAITKNLREGVSVTTEDRIIILSTCTTVDTQRYLVGGVLVNDKLTK